MAKTQLGVLCKLGHRHEGKPKSLRYTSNNDCVECVKLRNAEKAQKRLEYYHLNKTEINKDRRERYYPENKTKILARVAANQDNDRARLQQGKRRARKRQTAIRPITPDDLLRRYRVDFKRQCAYCDTFLYWNQVNWDHVVPLAKGGSHSLENLVPSCQGCNLSKGAKDVKVWIIEKGLKLPAWL